MSIGERSDVKTESDQGKPSSTTLDGSSSSSLHAPQQPPRIVKVESSSRASSSSSAAPPPPPHPHTAQCIPPGNSTGYDWTRGTASTDFSPPKNAPRRQGRMGEPVVLTANPRVTKSTSRGVLRSQASMKMDEKTSGFLREGGSPQIESITADLNQAAREIKTEEDNRNHNHSKRSSNKSFEVPKLSNIKKNINNSSTSLRPVQASAPTMQAGYIRHPPPGDIPQHPQYYYYHGTARSPIRNPYMNSYQQGGVSMHPSPFYHSSQDQAPLGSPPGYDVNSANRGMFYIASSSQKMPSSPPEWEQSKAAAAAAAASSAAAVTTSNIPKVDSVISQGDEPMMRKVGPLLRSPPPKKRRIVGSWDENDRKEDLDIGMPSPGVFRSPIDGKIRSRGFSMDPKRSPIFGGTPSRFGFSESVSFGMDTPGKLEADIFEQSPARFEQSPKFDLDPQPFSLPGIDTSNENEELGCSPPVQLGGEERIQDNPKRDKSSLWDLSPIQHDRLASPSSKENKGEEEKGEHFPFKSFTPKVLPATAASNKEAISVPPLSADKNQPPNISNLSKPSPPPHGMEPFRPQPPPYMQHRAPYPSPPGFRMEIGGVGGMKQSEVRKGMDGINSALNGRTNQSRDGPGAMQTPIKIGMAPVSTPNSMAMPVYPASTPRHGHGAMPPNLFPMSAPRHHPPIIVTGTPRSMQPKAKASPQLKRRQPCNCKKSKCLKLYCECFSAQLFCDGCNCNDCHNTPNHEALRNKAIKDTKAKNPSAFKSKTNSKQSASHTSGCKCKKSACLKKYCECFEAGIMCGAKCKCVNCQNFAGSQLLIERRRKIKDHKGVEMAMRPKEPMKGKGLKPVSVMPGHHIFPSPAQVVPGHRMGMHPMMSPPYMGRPAMMMNHMGYSPMSLPPGTPAYTHRVPRHPQHPTPQINPQRTPLLKTPKTPVARRDPASAKKANKGAKEEKSTYFGPRNGLQTKSSALAILSFLSNEEIYNASVVSKTWCKLALDDELWQFE